VVNEVKKININYEVISDEKHFLETKGILKNNELIFYDGKIKNKITILDNRITIERSNNFSLNLDFIMGKKAKGTYTIDSICYDIDIFTSFLEITQNKIVINYNLHNDKTLNFKVKIVYQFCK